MEGLGFSIPINDTIDIYKELIATGRVVRPFLGIEGIDIGEAESEKYQLPIGIFINKIIDAGSAQQAGLKSGDVIIGIDGETVTTMKRLNEIKKAKKVNDIIKISVNRGGETITVDAVLKEQP